MELEGRLAVVTGGASGIGRALVERFHAEGARHLVVVDRDAEGAKTVAATVSGSGFGLDVADEPQLRAMLREVERAHGGTDLFVSNAGYVTIGGLEAPVAEFQRMWEVHVLAHLYAARAVLPGMIARGSGYLLNTASAAGLLSQFGSLHYSVTKHAAVSLAEWIAITHGQQGIGVSVLCPQAVATNIEANSPTRNDVASGGSPAVAARDGVLDAAQVAEVVIEALAEERFWVLPHSEVAEYARRKANDVDRWIAGMQRWQQRLFPDAAHPANWLDEDGA